MSRPLTLETLHKLGACAVQFQRFALTFGEYADVTPELCESVADQFDWDWAASHLLSDAAEAEFDCVHGAAQAEYKRVTAPAWAEYDRVCDAAWAEFDRVTAPALAEYERVYDAAQAEYKRERLAAWAEYKRVTAPALAEYNRVRAREFGRLYADGGAT